MTARDDMPKIWGLIKEIRQNPENDVALRELEDMADASDSDRVKDFIASKIYEIKRKVIYPYAAAAQVGMIALAVV